MRAARPNSGKTATDGASCKIRGRACGEGEGLRSLIAERDPSPPRAAPEGNAAPALGHGAADGGNGVADLGNVAAPLRHGAAPWPPIAAILPPRPAALPPPDAPWGNDAANVPPCAAMRGNRLAPLSPERRAVAAGRRVGVLARGSSTAGALKPPCPLS